MLHSPAKRGWFRCAKGFIRIQHIAQRRQAAVTQREAAAEFYAVPTSVVDIGS